MAIVYLCQTGTYSSLLAANLHIGKINTKSSMQEIFLLTDFGNYKGFVGMFVFVGKDEENNLIYTLGIGNEAKLIMKSAKDLLQINSVSRNILFVDVSEYMPRYLLWCKTILSKKNYFDKLLVPKLEKSLQRLNLKVMETKEYIRQGLK